MKKRKLITLTLFFLLSSPAYAIPPPDFLINIGSQLAGVFGFIAVMLTAIFSIFFQYIKTAFHIVKNKKILLIGTITILLLAFLGTLTYKHYKEQQINQDWLQQSQANQPLQPPLPPKTPETPDSNPQNNFWLENQNTPLSISNKAFQQQLQNNPFILDAREDLENQYGHLTGSTHIRFADLQDGAYKDLPTDQKIYVLCWSGMRGQQVAEFLRSKNLVAIYLENGADDWYSSGGQWEGEIKFSQAYPSENFRLKLNTAQVKAEQQKGTTLVDVRESYKILAQPLAPYSIPLMETPSNQLEPLFNQIPENSRIITVCDNYTNCFMAKLVGVELQNRGHTFIGRYAEPWNY